MNVETLKQATKIQQKIDTLTRERDTLLNGANGNGVEPQEKHKSKRQAPIVSQRTRRLQSQKKKQWWKNHRAEMAAKKK